jgi:hypothetical protein
MAVFGRKDDVVVAQVDAMASPSIVWRCMHSCIVSWRGEHRHRTYCIPVRQHGVFMWNKYMDIF